MYIPNKINRIIGFHGWKERPNSHKGVEEAGYRLMELARYLNRDPGVMSRGLGQ